MSEGDITVLGPELFASTDDTVISWKGNNFYKACDFPVVVNDDGSGTHCVKREQHPGDIHEDYDGVRTTPEPKGRMVVVVSYPLADDPKKGHEETQEILHTLRPHFKDKNVDIYGAIREQADQIIMILEGDG